MEPRILTLAPKQLLGLKIRTSEAENRTLELWRSFMPRRKDIPGIVGSDLYSVQVFDASLRFDRFTVHTPFDKWAAVAVEGGGNIPPGMHTLVWDGLYAVFTHKGALATVAPTIAYIYGTWLPGSPYLADNRRPHVAVMGDKYRPDSPDNEEEIWVPIKRKE